MNRITKFLSYITTCLVFTVGAVCESRADSTFSVTTTNSTTSFDFSLTAVGTFTVDCGDGGTLTSSANPTDVSNGNTITRSDTATTTYTCTWQNAGAHTVLFDGTATNYDSTVNADNTYNPAISFYVGADDTASATNAGRIASISGNLSAIFPYISGNAPDGAQPRFVNTFHSATSLTSIPATLFADYTTASTHMFRATFRDCTGLTTLPSGLFFPNAQSVSGADRMFYLTFYGCTGLTSLPNGLFFPNAQSVSVARYMFIGTFYGCTRLTTVPSDLFSKITSGIEGLFRSTFYQCRGLTTLPSGLFFPNAQSVSGATEMFYRTFSGCTRLTTLPSDLFSKITSGAVDMFYQTFYGYSNLGCATAGCSTGTGYIPSTLFAGITPRGSNVTNTMRDTFTYTKFVETCPAGTTQYVTGWENYWGDNKVSCTPNTITIIWHGALAEDIATNDAGTVTYGGDIRTPVRPDPAQIPIGQRFKGWRFSKPSQN